MLILAGKTMTMQDPISLSIEALIFASDRSISEEDLVEVLRAAGNESITLQEVQEAITTIETKFNSEPFAMRLRKLDGGYQFLTDKVHYPVIQQLQFQRSKKRLSQQAIETLAIIAYRQPVTKLEIEQIRGVNSDYTVQKLLEKELIHIAGKSEGPGKPILYGTSSLFMDYFGIHSTAELPRMKDIAPAQNEIGVAIE